MTLPKLLSAKFILLSLLLTLFTPSVFACDTSPVITIGGPTDNGNGTYDISIIVCIGDGGSASGFLTDVGGGINIVGFTPPTLVDNNTAIGSLGGGNLDYDYAGGTAPGNMFTNEFAATCFPYTITVDADPVGQTITFTGVNSGHAGSCSFFGSDVQAGVIPAPPPPPATCGGNVSDGPGPYSNNEYVVTQICPLIFGDPVTISFNQFNLENNYDYLYVYDGPTILDPLIGTYTGTTNPPNITSTDPSGCLTVLFTTDGSVTNPGFNFDIICSPLLSIHLTDFYAECVAGTKSLSWETSSETDNDFFRVLYSNEGIDWEEIGIVDGSGTSAIDQYYQFTDVRKGYTGVGYYRLEQVDFDGSRTLSNTISLMHCSENASLELFPNPNTGKFRVRSNDATMESVAIYSTTGREVYRQEFPVLRADFELDVNLESGVYYVRVLSNSMEEVLKFVVRK